MNKIRNAGLCLAAGVGLVWLSTTADADGRRSIKDDVPPPFSWTGLYVGVHAGGGWADADWNHSQTAIPNEPISASPSGLVGGAQIGFQKQWGRWLAGVELSYSGADLDETVKSAAVTDRSRSVDINNIFLAGVRLGYVMDRSLIYVKGGYANAEVEISSNVISTGQLTSSSSKRENGWNIGAGWDYALTPNVTLGLQYDFISLDGSDRLNVQAPGLATTHHLDVDADIHTVTARLNYKFGGGW
jgi:outer membrane immunogenic protein